MRYFVAVVGERKKANACMPAGFLYTSPRVPHLAKLGAVRKAYTEVVGPLPEPEPITSETPLLPSPAPAPEAITPPPPAPVPSPVAPPTPAAPPESRKRYTKTY